MACYIYRIYPNSILEGQSKQLTIVGSGFISPISVIIGSFNIAPTLVTNSIIKLSLPTIPAGTYNVIIKNGDGTRWLTNSGLNISSSVLSPLMGSAACPIVLQQRIVDNLPTATQNNNLQNYIYSSSTEVTVDTETNIAVGSKPINSSYVAGENQELSQTSVSDNNSGNVNSPWGNFIND